LDGDITELRLDEPAKTSTSSIDDDPFVDVRTLTELSTRLEQGPSPSSYRLREAVTRLIATSTLCEAEKFVEGRPDITKDIDVRFALANLAIKSASPETARRLLREYQPKQDEQEYWGPWYGGTKLKYHRLLVALDGNTARKVAFERFVDDLSREKENIWSLIPDLPEIVEVISAQPEWHSIWNVLEEQLLHLRDYRLGTPADLAAHNEVDSEEKLLAKFYYQAFSLQIPELSRQARVALLTEGQRKAGLNIFSLVVDRLLADNNENAAEGISLLWAARHERVVAETYRERLAELASLSDFTITVTAQRLAEEWGVSLRISKRELPGLYSLVFDDERSAQVYEPPLGEQAAADGHVWINNALDWTWFLEREVGLLSEASNISEMHIRQRCAQLILQRGGVEKFGAPGDKRIAARLKQFEMRLTYQRPFSAGAIWALGQVAGELAHAGHLSPSYFPLLLFQLGFPATDTAFLIPAPRPAGIVRTQMRDNSFGQDRAEWIAQVERRQQSGPVYPLFNAVVCLVG
jgi:hypothetical protein